MASLLAFLYGYINMQNDWTYLNITTLFAIDTWTLICDQWTEKENQSMKTGV